VMLVADVKMIGPAYAVPAVREPARPPAIIRAAVTPAARRQLTLIRFTLCTVEHLPPVG
jgi:hypothetical protein